MSSSQHEQEVVTIIYYCDSSLELKHEVCDLMKSDSGRIIIPNAFKKNKSIVAVCHGKVDILNKVGDRIIGAEFVA